MGAPKESQTGVMAANELYWGSNQSVNKIAEGLELSKSALYDMIRPKPLDLSCPLCGQGIVYANRTACEKGVANCSECEWKGPENEANSFIAERPVALPTYGDQEVVGLDKHPEKASTSLPTGLDSSTAHTVAVGALLGAAAGLALVIWTWRR
jgi:predicted RNA-binding Zn-ribbon protein involved in translation (DUF1610 family)